MQKQLIEYKKDDKILGFFLLKSKTLRTSNKGSEYLDLVISDRSGDMIAKVWDLTMPDTEHAREIESRTVVKIKGAITDFNGQRQAKILKIRPARPDDPVELSTLIPSAPLESEDMYREILDSIDL